jgi:hypothetical protein
LVCTTDERLMCVRCFNMFCVLHEWTSLTYVQHAAAAAGAAGAAKAATAAVASCE